MVLHENGFSEHTQKSETKKWRTRMPQPSGNGCHFFGRVCMYMCIKTAIREIYWRRRRHLPVSCQPAPVQSLCTHNKISQCQYSSTESF